MKRHTDGASKCHSRLVQHAAVETFWLRVRPPHSRRRLKSETHSCLPVYEERHHQAELKDLTDFMHDGDARMLACARCGLLLRDEEQTRATASYEADPNDPGVMQHVYRRYVTSFRNKAPAYRDQLRPHASVVELGPHLGGFLQAAEEWDWCPIGLDIGKDTSDFARRQGLTVRRETIEDTKIPAGSADGVFIWNCFEQLAEPHETLTAARRLLRRHGLLALRVPNASSWKRFRTQNNPFARGVLAWNNLLGFPYLYGYNKANLTMLARRFGFEPVSAFHSELLTMPFPDPAKHVVVEQKAISDETGELVRRGLMESPWIELLFRREDEIRRCWPKITHSFLQRAVA